MVQVAMHDSGVACWDAKYTYWTLRPHQYDTTYRPLFTVANHPSFPSAHSCFSAAAAGVMTALFPRETAPMAELVREAGQARIWGGLHYESDITAGNAIGHAVAARVIARARADGDRLP
jgi:membrane-associated phospholipid phosphatase